MIRTNFRKVSMRALAPMFVMLLAGALPSDASADCPAISLDMATRQAMNWFEGTLGFQCHYHEFLKNVFECHDGSANFENTVLTMTYTQAMPYTHYVDSYAVNADGSQDCSGRFYCDLCTGACGMVANQPACD